MEIDSRAWSSWGGKAASVDAEDVVARAAAERRRRRMLRLLIGVAGMCGIVVLAAIGVAMSRPVSEEIEAVNMAKFFRDAEPLGTPPPAPAGAGGYAFLYHQGDGTGNPVAFDPCSPIHYLVRPQNAPAGGARMIESAVAEVSRATGLQFVYDGESDEAPSGGWFAYQWNSSIYEPILVAWSNELEAPHLAGEVAGYASSAYVGGAVWSAKPVPGARQYVSGQVVLDAEDLAWALDERDGRKATRATIMHELGHLVGLGHVDDPTQLMYSGWNDVYEFQDGDLRGLHRLGTGRCFIG